MNNIAGRLEKETKFYEKMKVKFEAYKELVTLVNLDIKPSQYRKLVQR